MCIRDRPVYHGEGLLVAKLVIAGTLSVAAFLASSWIVRLREPFVMISEARHWFYDRHRLPADNFEPG
ncbi:MAG: hypothetical protein N2255_08085, partial [Kiritimatiellae bacterium]|nr:hypothetical protein [Kiritimatiellia bacterium]